MPPFSFSLLILLPLLLLLLLTLSSTAEARNIENNLPKSPRKQADKFIRELNLFPVNDVNIVENDHFAPEAKLVETSFRLPYLNGAAATVQDFGHHAGYYSLSHTKGARMFYYFFESRNKNVSAPVVIWLSGGPGCSGSLALFYENGPFHLTNNLSLVLNDFGWDKESNLIYLDQPIGTGFSYSSSTDDIRTSSEEAANDFSDFLQAFFEKHPQYAKNDFYITGESYAGHYIPAFAAQVQKNNKNKQGIHINLKGLAIGNGLTDPAIQYPAYRDYALDTKLITEADYNDLNETVATCQDEARSCGNDNSSSSCDQVYTECTSIFNQILTINSGINYYDIRKTCQGSLCYDFSNVEKFLNEDSVKQALGVGRDVEFVSCSSSVYEAMTGDWMKNFELGIPWLLQDGVKLLIYAGEYDLICNWLGNSRWVDKMVWSGQRGYLSAPSSEFVVEGVKAGLQKSYGPLTFLKVYDAGHLVPMDQPKASLEMLRRWMQGLPL